MQKSQRGVREKIYSGSKKNKNKKKLRKLLKWKLEGCPGILSDQSKSHFGRLDRMPNRKYDKRVGGGGGRLWSNLKKAVPISSSQFALSGGSPVKEKDQTKDKTDNYFCQAS